MTGNVPRIIPLEEGWENEIKAKVRRANRAVCAYACNLRAFGAARVYNTNTVCSGACRLFLRLKSVLLHFLSSKLLSALCFRILFVIYV
jgi:hypothetical protein